MGDEAKKNMQMAAWISGEEWAETTQAQEYGNGCAVLAPGEPPSADQIPTAAGRLHAPQKRARSCGGCVSDLRLQGDGLVP
jgi:hypothetical protein